jgi:AcrR family transcriptional regulator
MRTRPPRPRRRPAAGPDSRSRILSTAADEFATRGFAATTVDRIARHARVNKAMIYYHFPNKRALYTAIVREHFTPIVDKLAAAVAEPASPDRQLDRVIQTLVEAIDASKPFLPIFLREIADGAAHLGPDDLAPIAGIFGIVRGIIAEGTRRKIFQPVHPALAHFTIVGPIVMFRASAPVRARIQSTRGVVIPDADSATIVKHLQMVARRMLARE